MPDDDSTDGSFNATLDTLTKFSETSIYKEIFGPLFKPSAKPAGIVFGLGFKSLELVGRAVAKRCWGQEEYINFIAQCDERLMAIPDNDLIEPEPRIAIPLLEAVQIHGYDENLRELFVNLLISSMNSQNFSTVHPSFVRIIKELSTNEALILKELAKLGNAPVVTISQKMGYAGRLTLVKYYSNLGVQGRLLNVATETAGLENLIRLGLIEIPADMKIVSEGIYTDILNDNFVDRYRVVSTGDHVIQKLFMRPTGLGINFIRACIDENAEHHCGTYAQSQEEYL